jgi:hypothetical protein
MASGTAGFAGVGLACNAAGAAATGTTFGLAETGVAFGLAETGVAFGLAATGLGRGNGTGLVGFGAASAASTPISKAAEARAAWRQRLKVNGFPPPDAALSNRRRRC